MIGQQAKERAVLERGLSWGRESGGDHSHDRKLQGEPWAPPFGLKVLNFALAFSNPYIFVSLKS